MGKRRLLLGTTPIGGKAVKSRRKAREVTSAYHNIQNELSQVQKDGTLTTMEKEERKRGLMKQMEAIGGVDKYQQASIISTTHFKTSRWVVSVLEELGRKPLSSSSSSSSSSPKLATLEVGAINIQLQQCSWLRVRAIDLNSQHPSIETCDFFSLPPCGAYDVVVCSMVVNCVPDAPRRGEMLLRLRAHLEPSRGVLFLVLPLRCVRSTHVGEEAFDALLAAAGFRPWAEKRISPRLVFYVLGRKEDIIGGNAGGIGDGEGWRDDATRRLDRDLPERIKKHFRQGFDDVPPTEFCLSLKEFV